MKDDSSEVISKKILDWLTGLITLAAALSTIIGVFFSDDQKAQQAAYIAAFVLILVSGAIYFYQRRRAARLKIAESLEPLSASAALRGLLPFEEGDELPGRGRDVQDIFTLVSSSAFRFGVLWGESGCGKTSLLRASLVPRLKNEKYLPLYISKPTNDPQEAIRLALAKELGGATKKSDKDLKSQLRDATPKGKKIIILFDQFEEFFLTNRTPSSRAGFIKWLGSIVSDEKLPIVFLIGIRGDFFVQLQNFHPQIPEPTSTRSTYQLQNFDSEQAKQIFSAAAKADGIAFEPELIQAVIKELEAEDFIRPAELQVVGTRLKRKNITRLSQYEVLEGARRILSSYISEEIKQSSNEQAARLILRLMCADVVETKSQIDLSLDDILRGVRGIEQPGGEKAAGYPDEIQAILKQFVNARVLIHTDDDKYNLVHDYLAPYVRTATEGAVTNTERANRMLKRYVAEYKEDPKTRIPFGRVRLIGKYASPEVIVKDKSQELIKKSKRAFYVMVTSLVMPLILILAIYFFYLSNSYYLGIENSYIVIYSGLPHLPGSGHLVIQTDLKQEDLLDKNISNDINRGKVTGFWFEKVEPAKGGYQVWGEQTQEGLSALPHAQILRWLGQSDDSKNILIYTITDLQADSSVRSDAVNGLGLLTQGNPSAVTSDLLQNLVNIIIDSHADPNLRFNAANSLVSLAQANPNAVTSDLFPELVDALIDPQADSSVRSSAGVALGSLAHANPGTVTSDLLQKVVNIVTSIEQAASSLPNNTWYALESLAQANPEAVTPEMIQKLVNFATNPQNDPNARSNAHFYVLAALAPANPKAITSEVIQKLVDIVTDLEVDSNENTDSLLGLLANANPEAVTPEMTQKLVDFIADSQAKPLVRAQAANALGSLTRANPESVRPEVIQKLVDFITDSQADSAHSNVVYALVSFGQAKPKIITSSLLQKLIDDYTTWPYDSFTRSSARNALVLLSQANPKAITSDLLPNLIDIVTDPEADSSVRYYTADAVGILAPINPKAVTSDLLRKMTDFGNSAPLPPIDTMQYIVGATLISLVQANPNAVTPDLLADLLPKWVDILTAPPADSNMYFYAVKVLSTLAQDNPKVVTKVVTSDLLQKMLNIATDPDSNFNIRSEAVYALGSLAPVNPDTVTSEMIQTMLDMGTMVIDPNYEHEYSNLRSSAMDALGSLARANPEAVTSGMIQKLIEIVTDPHGDSSVRSNAANALGLLVQANAETVTSDKLMNFATNPQADSDVGSSTTNILESLAHANPNAVTSDLIQNLVNVVTDSQADSETRFHAAKSLGSLAQVRPDAVTSKMVQSLLGQLKVNTDGQGRNAAAYALFGISFGDPNQEKIIREELIELSTSLKPHWRVAANRTLEMVAIGDLVEESRSYPEQIELIKSRLNYLIGLDSSLNEEHLRFAAQVVLQEITKIEAETKK